MDDKQLLDGIVAGGFLNSDAAQKILKDAALVGKKPEEIIYERHLVPEEEVAKSKARTSSDAAVQTAPAGETTSAAFEKAVNSKDFAKIESLMSARIYYVVDASDCCGDITKKEAVAHLKNYIRDAKSFDFDQNQQVIRQMKVNLADTFAKYTIGIANNRMVLSYHLDKQGKVDDLMLSASHLMYDLE